VRPSNISSGLIDIQNDLKDGGGSALSDGIADALDPEWRKGKESNRFKSARNSMEFDKS